MTTRTNADTISKTPEADAARLKELMRNVDKTQAEFAAENDIGSQAQLWQYLNPETKKGRPLNITAAIGFAKGLKVPVSSFSPSLQEVIDRIARYASSKEISSYPQAASEAAPVTYLEPKSTDDKEIEQVISLLNRTEARGIAVVLDKAKEMADKYPRVKQTPKSSA